MKIVLLTPKQWTRSREQLIRMMIAWGGGRLSATGLAALQAMRPSELEASESAPEAAVAVLLQDGRPAGAAFARKAGREACLVAVSPPARGRGAGSGLLLKLQLLWGSLACRVAADNTASLNMCFRAGMTAIGLVDGPTGKPTLLFQSSNSASPVGQEAEQAPTPQTAVRTRSTADATSLGCESPLAAATGRSPNPKRMVKAPPTALLRGPEVERRPTVPRSDDNDTAHTRHFNVIPR
ncbi:Acetyltransferase (GNAT) family protein [Paenibacillaceae bacterium GAS479]|nr:Acetyltransferase (GNAT) family protein [Paenibacillaceae bacterium GAS479]